MERLGNGKGYGNFGNLLHGLQIISFARLCQIFPNYSQITARELPPPFVGESQDGGEQLSPLHAAVQ